MDRPPIVEGALALDDRGVVLGLGSRTELRRAHPQGVEERVEGALLPGLVNAHCHLELSALAALGDRPIGGGTGLVDWALEVMPLSAAVTSEERRVAAARAAAATVRAGTAALGDTGNSVAAVAGLAAAGLRGMFFHELVGSRETRTGDALADAAAEQEREFGSAARWPQEIAYVPAPHAPYSVGADLLRRIFAAAARAGLPTSVHLAEDEDEVALLRDGGGRWPAVLETMGVDPATRIPRRSPLAYLASLGAFETPAPPLLVHMVHAGADDRRLARAARATVVLCARSNLHIGRRLPDVPALLGDGVSLALGTDSLASTPDLSLWGEIETLRSHFPAIPEAVWLEAATRGGAQAMRLSGMGTLTPGKRPGVIAVDLQDPSHPIESLARTPAPALRWMARA
jgi:cytosine/adenosine deaminase-related metal-dependent hydrolase